MTQLFPDIGFTRLIWIEIEWVLSESGTRKQCLFWIMELVPMERIHSLWIQWKLIAITRNKNIGRNRWMNLNPRNHVCKYDRVKQESYQTMSGYQLPEIGIKQIQNNSYED